MPKRMLTICKKIGCSALVENRGYCPTHAPQAATEAKQKQRQAFDRLLLRRTSEEHQFYQSEAWHEKSRQHRRTEPLCRECKTNSIIQAAEMVHHVPELSVLLAREENPFDDAFLVSLCNRCHLAELRERKAK